MMISNYGIGSGFVMPENVLNVHPFVAVSYLNPVSSDIV